MAGGATHSRGRLLLWVVASALGIGTVALGAIAVFRQDIAEYLLLGELRRLGLGTVDLTIARFDRERVELRDLRVGDDLVVPSIQAEYSPMGLFARRLDSLRVSGLRLRGAIDTSSVSFGRLGALLNQTESSAADSSASFSLPMRRVDVDDARIELTTPQGTLLGQLHASASETTPGRLAATAEFTATHRLANLNARLTALGTPNTLAGEISIDAQMSGQFGSRLHARAVSLSAETLFEYDRGEIVIRAPDCATLHFEPLALPELLSLSQPLELCFHSGDANALKLGRDGRTEVHLEIEPARIAAKVGALSVTGELPALTANGNPSAAGTLSLTAHGGDLRVAELALGARGFELQAEISPESVLPSSELRVERLFDTGEAKRFPDLSLSGNSNTDPKAPDTIEFGLELSDRDRNLVVSVDGRHDTAQGRGSAGVQFEPFRFCPGGPKLTDAFPLLRGILSNAQGTLVSSGSVEWGGTRPRAKLEVALIDLSATALASVIERANTTFEIRDWGTPPGQLLSIGRIDFGLQLTHGKVRFQLRPDRLLAIESATFQFAGGSLDTSALIDPVSESQHLTFAVRDVDLATLLGMVKFEGLSGTGTLVGNLPIHRSGDEIEIRSAKLQSDDAGGVIRYSNDGGAAALRSRDEYVNRMLTALENFHYQKLSLEIDGQALETVKVTIHLEGSNPDFEGGQPYNFNVAVESRLADLISSEGFVYQIPSVVEQRFAELMGQPMNNPPQPCVHDD